MAVSGTTSTTSTAAATPSAVITSTAPTTSTASTAASAVTTNSIDVASIVASLMSIENKPLTALQNQVTTSQTIISDLGTIKSKVATLQSALSTFEDPSTYNNPAVSSTDSTVVTATATSAASIGSINIAVTQIAKPAQIILTKYSGTNFTSANDTVSFDPANGFKLTVGGKTYSTMDAATPIQSTGAGGQSTLTDLQNWINGLGANVTARALQTTSASNWVLQISGTASGVANNVSVDTGTKGTGSSISNLSFALTPSQIFPATPGTAGTLTVPLTGGSGSGATANVSYDATGAVTSVQLQNAGTGYKSGDALTIALASTNQDTNSTQFSALAAGKTVVLDGLTFTAGANGATAAQVASAFANLPATATSFSAINTANKLTGDSTGGVFTGGTTIAGLSSGLVNANNTVVFDGAGYINATGSGSVAGNAATTGVATAALSGIGATTKINTPTVNQFVSWVNGLGAGVNATFDGSSIGISGTQNGQDITVDFSGLNNNISRTTTSLSAMGMDLQLDGTIQFNTASYQTAVSNGLFNKLSIGLKMGFSGVTSNLDNFLTSEIDPTKGALVAEITNQQNSILDIQKRETDLQTRLNSIQQGYINQYSALNALLFQLNSTSTSLASSLAAVTNINAGK